MLGISAPKKDTDGPSPADGDWHQADTDKTIEATSSHWIDSDDAPAKTPPGTKIAVIALGVGVLALVIVAIAVSIKVKEQSQRASKTEVPKGIGQAKGETVKVTLKADQLAAWRKVRKEHAEMPVRVLGCLARTYGKQAFDLIGASDDSWHFAHQDRIFTSGPLIGQEAPPWAEAFELGHAYYPSAFSKEFEDTEKYRVLLERKREEEAKRSEEPSLPSPFLDSFEDILKSDKDWWERQKFPSSLKYAEKFCQRKEVKATAVVDVFGNEAPRILHWFWNDGLRTKSSVSPPNRDRQESLQRFLTALMQQGADL